MRVDSLLLLFALCLWTRHNFPGLRSHRDGIKKGDSPWLVLTHQLCGRGAFVSDERVLAASMTMRMSVPSTVTVIMAVTRGGFGAQAFEARGFSYHLLRRRRNHTTLSSTSPLHTKSIYSKAHTPTAVGGRRRVSSKGLLTII
jgi:hypothetical protein